MNAKNFWKMAAILVILWLLYRAYAISAEIISNFDLLVVFADAVVFVIMISILVLFIKKNKWGFNIGKYFSQFALIISFLVLLLRLLFFAISNFDLNLINMEYFLIPIVGIVYFSLLHFAIIQSKKLFKI